MPGKTEKMEENVKVDEVIINEESVMLDGVILNESSSKKMRPNRQPKSKDQLIKCQFCPKSFSALRWNTGHCNKDHLDLIKDIWHVCDPCQIYFPTATSLFTHNGQKHVAPKTPIPKLERIRCSYCPRTFRHQTDCRNHCHKSHREEVENDWIKCTFCDRSFQSALSQRRHIMLRHKASPEKKGYSFNCKFCAKKFARSQSTMYYEHCNADHVEAVVTSKWIICDACGLYFPPKIIKSHVSMTHRRTEPHRCTFCPKEYHVFYRLVEHCNFKHPFEVAKSWIKCSLCDMLYPTQESLDVHIETVHKAFGCQFCPRKCDTAKELRTHTNISHFQEASETWFKCGNCKTLFKTEEELKEGHKCNRQTETHCEFCPKLFASNVKYYRHANRQHQEEVSKLWLNCQACSHFFPSDAELKRHPWCLKARSQIKCDFCDAEETFTDSSTYFSHANDFHLGEIEKLWLMCKFCSFYFPSQQQLSHHQIKKHNEGKTTKKKKLKVKCTFCSNIFSNKKEYALHANAEHKDSLFEQWLHCPECDFFVETETDLIKHLRKFHEKEVGKKLVKRKMKQAIDAGNGNKEIGKEDGNVQCQFCPEMFFSSKLSTYYVHANDCHSKELLLHWHPCQDCNRFYPTRTSLRTHQRGHKKKTAEEEPDSKSNFVRKICSTRKREHSGTRTSKSKETFNRREDVPRLKNKLVNLKVKLSRNDISSWHHCSECDVFLPTQKTFRKHDHSNGSKEIGRGHNGSEKVVRSRNEPNDVVRINLVRAEFGRRTSPSAITSTLKDDSKSWKSCEDCGTFLPNKKALRNHKISNHPGGSCDLIEMERNKTIDEDSRDVIETEINIKDEYCDDDVTIDDVTMDDDCDSNFSLNDSVHVGQSILKPARSVEIQTTPDVIVKTRSPTLIPKLTRASTTENDVREENLDVCKVCGEKFEDKNEMIRHLYEAHINL